MTIQRRLLACFLLVFWVPAAAPSLVLALQPLAVGTTTKSTSGTTRSSAGKASSSFVIESGTWRFGEQEHPIAYEYCNPNRAHRDSSSDDIPVLLLNGFGMGSFHQHRLMEALHHQSNSTPAGGARPTGAVYAMDYLGQGKSWPRDCNDGNGATEQGLRYCGKTWVEQIIQFIEQVIPTKRVHLVGNSVGGHLAVFVAAARPDLVESTTLLNATPVWGLNLPGW